MPPAAAKEKGGRELGPLHTVPQTAFPRPRQEDCVPLHPLLKRALTVLLIGLCHFVSACRFAKIGCNDFLITAYLIGQTFRYFTSIVEHSDAVRHTHGH